MGDTFATAVRERTYDAWVTKSTDTFSACGFNGTPSIVVAGNQVRGPGGTLPTTEVFTQAGTQAAG